MFAVVFLPSDAISPPAAVAELLTLVGAGAGKIGAGHPKEPADSMIDTNGEPIWPDPDPRAAPRLSHDPTGVTDQCATWVRQMTASLGWKIERTYVTKEAKWGVVYRADVATQDDPPGRTRYMCWMSTGRHPGLAVFAHPLKMLDARQSLDRLPAE